MTIRRESGTRQGLASEPLLQRMVARIVERFHPLQVILFGSHARREAGQHSDVDLLVVLPEVRDQRDVTREILRALRDFPLPKDVVVTTPGELARRGNLVGTVLRPALRQGKVLYELRADGLPASGYRHGNPAQMGDDSSDDAERLEETRTWLDHARLDLRAADGAIGNPAMAPYHACFLAQQAAEKALKAVLVFLQIEYPYTHDLDALRRLVPRGWRLRQEHPALGDLTRWAVAGRYPSRRAGPTEADAESAVRQARAVVESVERDLRQHGFEAEQA